MTTDMISEINKRFKKSLSKDPSTLTCIITGRSRPTNTLYLEKKAITAGSKENFINHYICREAYSLLKSGKTVLQVREELGVSNEWPIPDDVKVANALKFNGK
jgi:hypothetical protein